MRETADCYSQGRNRRGSEARIGGEDRRRGSELRQGRYIRPVHGKSSSRPTSLVLAAPAKFGTRASGSAESVSQQSAVSSQQSAVNSRRLTIAWHIRGAEKPLRASALASQHERAISRTRERVSRIRCACRGQESGTGMEGGREGGATVAAGREEGPTSVGGGAEGRGESVEISAK
jgi:hypothetical protein